MATVAQIVRSKMVALTSKGANYSITTISRLYGIIKIAFSIVRQTKRKVTQVDVCRKINQLPILLGVVKA